jgi:hypothetical protein
VKGVQNYLLNTDVQRMNWCATWKNKTSTSILDKRKTVFNYGA